MSCCDHLPSIVHHPSTFLNDFFSRSPEPVFLKLLKEPSVKEWLKNCKNGHGPLINLAVMPIYDRNT